ncbi:protocadherin alpha-C2-like, partial [Protopterus annectens]|uniref:protocadherin alpha-C2-like n=1 Tax=Protopterus annectens TaxID=7888 RepID=UPI001CFBBC32
NVSGRHFRLVSEDGKQNLFTTSENGNSFVKERIDREAICFVKVQCYVNMKVIINNPLEMHHVKVEIQDVNDNAPTFPFKDLYLNIMELVPPGTKFPLHIAHDPDVGSNGLHSYRLSSSRYFSLDMQDSNEDVNVPQLVLENNLDREQESVHHLSLTAVDGGQPERSGSIDITINVVDANDNSPKFDQAVYKASLMEDAPVGTLIIQLKATDSDEGTNGEIEYSFSTHIPDKTHSLFEIGLTSGEIILKGRVDFEEINMYEFHVQATDKGTSPLFGYCKVLIDVVDVNDNKPSILLTSFTRDVSENSSRGTVVALISVIDKDSGINAQVSCKIHDNIPFTLTSVENHYILEISGTIDRELSDSYNISLTATDFGVPPLSTDAFILVHISDVNDNPPQFTEMAYRSVIAENNSPGEILCQVTAMDPDLKENGTVAYSFVEEQIEGMSLFNYLSIDSENGRVYAKTMFDYEKIKAFKLQIVAKDLGNPSLSSTAELIVTIIDQNDNSPTFLYPPASVGNVPIEMIPRSAEAGFLVTKVITVDEDSGQNAWLSYQLLQSTDVSLFDIDKQTGEIRIVRSISARDNRRQKLVVEVKDNGAPRRSAAVTIGILLYDSFPQVLPDFEETTENSEEVSNKNLVLIVTVVAISCVFLGGLIIFISLSCYRSISSGICPCPFACCIDNFDGYKLKIPGPPGCTVQNNLVQISETGTLLQGYQYMAFLGQVSPSRKVLLRNSLLEARGENAANTPGCCIPVPVSGHSETNSATEVCKKMYQQEYSVCLVIVILNYCLSYKMLV